jgi:hypothetical protein
LLTRTVPPAQPANRARRSALGAPLAIVKQVGQDEYWRVYDATGPGRNVYTDVA